MILMLGAGVKRLSLRGPSVTMKIDRKTSKRDVVPGVYNATLKIMHSCELASYYQQNEHFNNDIETHSMVE